MAKSYLPETLRETAAINRHRIATLIADLSRSVFLLTVDIEHEETRAGVRDVSDPAYSVLARRLRKRRDNLAATIASLEALVHTSQRAA
ncbi:MAG: hypothetical protein JO141_09015 [Bradyrhizobium sp.]|nr:hypothetical protein [Bradyrhizobium sp.]